MPGCGAISDGVDGAVLLAKKQAVRCCDWSGWCLDGWVGRAISEGRDVVMRGRSIVSTLMEMLHVLYIHLPYCRHSSSSSSPPQSNSPSRGCSSDYMVGCGGDHQPQCHLVAVLHREPRYGTLTGQFGRQLHNHLCLAYCTP